MHRISSSCWEFSVFLNLLQFTGGVLHFVGVFRFLYFMIKCSFVVHPVLVIPINVISVRLKLFVIFTILFLSWFCCVYISVDDNSLFFYLYFYG